MSYPLESAGSRQPAWLKLGAGSAHHAPSRRRSATFGGAISCNAPALAAAYGCHMARSEIRATIRRGDDLAVAGLVLGYLAFCMAVLFLIYSTFNR
ncbi:DUF4190 domain-containing protein [Nonomuraea sp. NPDC005650]|uniref:DUF4190 domain-containing protein n=1 Tax=Nonomuraea sp. NPDC005650 TaxID=3157045 RepID=UPI0033AAF9FB